MKNALATEVGYHLRDRLGYFLWSAIFEAPRPTKSGSATSALTITLKAARQVGKMLKPDCTTPNPKYRFDRRS